MWTNAEKAAANIARRELGWERPQYEMVLRNIAGIRPHMGKISSTSPSATHDGLVRFMAFCEAQGFIDAKNGQGFWTRQAAKECPRMHHAVRDLAGRAYRAGALADGALEGYVARMTSERPAEQGGQTRTLEECNWEYTYKIFEGLKAWVARVCRDRRLSLAV